MSDLSHVKQTLKLRLDELQQRINRIDDELRAQLPADFEEQASQLEGQDALQGIEDSALLEISQIQAALRRIDDGTYGICAECGDDIAPKRLAALPTAVKCINCAR